MPLLVRPGGEPPRILREPREPSLDERVDAPVGEPSITRSRAGGASREQRDRFVDVTYRMHVKPTFSDRGNQLRAKHQVLDVRSRNDDTLIARQAPLATDVEEAFDLVVDAADRLHITALVHRSSDRESLSDRHVGDRRQQRAELGERRTVTLDPAVRLLEHDRRRQR